MGPVAVGSTGGPAGAATALRLGCMWGMILLRIIPVCNFMAAQGFDPVPRSGALAGVAALHVAVVAALLMVPQVHERLVEPSPLFVQFNEAPREQRAAAPARPIAMPSLTEPAPVP